MIGLWRVPAYLQLGRSESWIGPIAVMTLGLGLGAVLVRFPIEATVAGLAILTVGVALITGERTTPWFLSLLTGLLAGYALLGRGFAYVGFTRFFVGDVVMAIGLVVAFARGHFRTALKSVPAKILAAFCVLGVLRTAPYLHDFGWDGLRDAASWGYAGFAFLVAGSVTSRDRLIAICKKYASCLPFMVAWLPIASLIYRLNPQFIPRVHGGAVPIIQVEPGDACVHLLGAAAFVMLGLKKRLTTPSSSGTGFGEWTLWLPWIIGASIASISRGGLLAILAGFLVILAFRLNTRWTKFLVALLLITILWLWTGVEIDVGGDRTISPQQLVANLYSVVGVDLREGLEGSRRWRLLWWGTIVDYTVLGPYFWSGKGFGINLADDDGFQVFSDSSLRSPHSAHMNILARMGVPGAVGWVGFNLLLVFGLVRGARQAARDGDSWGADLRVWILAYWTAFIVSMSFDLTLEGPHGGIWFWSLCGLALSLIGNSMVSRLNCQTMKQS